MYTYTKYLPVIIPLASVSGIFFHWTGSWFVLVEAIMVMFDGGALGTNFTRRESIQLLLKLSFSLYLLR